ncbi:MAG: type II toxin-antitoxin system VapC family toxin [Gemmatimonadales bacterium]
MAPLYRPVFVDTSAWVALIYRRDQARKKAVSVWPSLRAGRRNLITTELVATETYNLLLYRIGNEAALAFMDKLLMRSHQRIVWTDADLAAVAVEAWLRRYRDQAFSFTDAVSFEVMEREAVREAFAFDTDFERAGFRLLPECS